MVRSSIETPSCKIINQPEVKLTICFDPYNKRIRVDEIKGDLDQAYQIILAETPGWVEKIIIKSKTAHQRIFLDKGFSHEGGIPAYFNGEDMFFLVKYTTHERRKSTGEDEEKNILNKILASNRAVLKSTHSIIKTADQSDAEKLAQLYDKVFSVYPTPLGKAEYVEKTRENGTIYVYIEENDRIVSAASAEINYKYSNAELTDCATMKEAQGRGHMMLLIAKLEEILDKKNIGVNYSLARARSYAMNKIFYNLGYKHCGKLINNCNIYSGLENMNIWHKINYRT